MFGSRRSYQSTASEEEVLPRQPVSIASALRQTFKEGYTLKDFVHDLGAGSVVGVVAIPLSMALAIATGVPPQVGLYTAIVAGAIAALLGGSRVQVSGPTAAFVVILVPIVHDHGLGGLLIATMMAGIILYFMGLAGLGRLIEFVPYPVTCGFTAGIAVVIATLQIKDFFGLPIEHMPESYVEKLIEIVRHAGHVRWPDLVIASASLILLIVFPRITRKVPAPLAVLPLMAIAPLLLQLVVPDFAPDTINSRFSYEAGGVTHGGIPQMPPPFALPWNMPGKDGQPIGLSWDLIRNLLPAALAIAVLASIESLLSAVIADGITGRKHNPDAELMAIGTANMVGPFFGGIAATGAIARTAANIRFGARSPLASFTHAMVILASVLVFAPFLGYLPTGALAALLLIVAWNMSEAKHFIHVLRIAPRADIAVLLLCFALTVLFDMVIAVSVGLALASMLFIRRMAEVAHVRLVSDDMPEHPKTLPKGVIIYEIAGPLFFGAAEKAMSSLSVVGGDIKTVLFDCRKINALDVTGMINLESAIRKLHSRNIRVIIAGLTGQPMHALRKAGWRQEGGRLSICPSFEDALMVATLAEQTFQPDAL
ncbi:MAG: sodium-independent anion transporter [Candidatus Hydrogenedentota bacterium]